MTLSDAELAVERDWLLEHGRSVEEVERMQAAAVAPARVISNGYVYWPELMHRTGALVLVMPKGMARVGTLMRPDPIADRHLVSLLERDAGASTLRAPGETR